MLQVSADLKTAIQLLMSMQEYPDMPSASDVIKELRYLQECVKNTEQYIKVPFRRGHGSSEFEVAYDVVQELREFYLGGNQLKEFGFRPRAYFKLVVEPIGDMMEQCSHDAILDSIEMVVEQLIEQVEMFDHAGQVPAGAAYRQYKKIIEQRRTNRRIMHITTEVMKLRRKTLTLIKESRRLQNNRG